jgi:hypothetical protein
MKKLVSLTIMVLIFVSLSVLLGSVIQGMGGPAHAAYPYPTPTQNPYPFRIAHFPIMYRLVQSSIGNGDLGELP